MKPDARRRTKKSIKETKKSTVKEKAAKENKKQPPKAAKLSKNNAKSANNESTSSISKKRTAAERLKLQTTKKSRAQQRLDHKIAEAAKEQTNNHGSDDENPVLLRRKKDRFDPEQHGVSLDHYLLLAAQKVALAADHFSAADQENGTNRLQLPDQHGVGVAESPTGALAKLRGRGVGSAIKDQAPPAADHVDIHEGAIIPAELGFLRANKTPEEHPLAGVVVKAGAIGDWMKKSCVAGRNLEVHVVVGRKMVFTVVAELAEDGDVEAAVGLGSAGCLYKNVRLADIRNRSRLQKDFAKLAAYFRDAKQQWVRSRKRINKERAGTATLLQNNQKVDEPELPLTTAELTRFAQRVRNHLETCMNCRPLFGVAGVEIGHYFRDPLPRKASSPTSAKSKRQKTENHVAGMAKSKGEDAEVERKDKESDEIEISSAPEEFEDDPKPSAVVSSFHWVRFDGSRVPDPLRTRRLHAQEQDPDAFDLVDEETLDDSLPPKLFSLDLRGFQMYGSHPGRIRHRDKDLLLDVKGKVPVDGEHEQCDNVDIKRVGVGQGQREQHGHEGILLPQNPALFFGKKEFVERLQWNGAELERAVETDPAFGWLRKAWGAREGLVGLLDAARGNLGALDDGNDDDSDEGL
eukprot:g2680.t1